MAKKRRNRNEGSRPKPRSIPWSLVVAYAIGAAFVVAGALVVIFGRSAPEQGVDVPPGQMIEFGVGMIVLGVLAGGLTALIQRSARKHK